MRGPLIIALLAAYVFVVLARVGGHYVHILPVMAMAIYIYGLFKFKSAGVSSDLSASTSSHVALSSAPSPGSPLDTPLAPLTQSDPNRNLPESD